MTTLNISDDINNVVNSNNINDGNNSSQPKNSDYYGQQLRRDIVYDTLQHNVSQPQVTTSDYLSTKLMKKQILEDVNTMNRPRTLAPKGYVAKGTLNDIPVIARFGTNLLGSLMSTTMAIKCFLVDGTTYDICYTVSYPQNYVLNTCNMYNRCITFMGQLDATNASIIYFTNNSFPLVGAVKSCIDLSPVIGSVGQYELSSICYVSTADSQNNNDNKLTPTQIVNCGKGTIWHIKQQVPSYGTVGILQLEPFNLDPTFGNNLYFKMNIKKSSSPLWFLSTKVGGALAVMSLRLNGYIRWYLGLDIGDH